MLERRKADEGDAVLGVLRAVSESVPLTAGQRLHRCPVCESSGIATGDHGVEWVPTDWDKETGQVTSVDGEVWFTAQAFRCRVCGLHLDSQADIDACFDPVWEIEDADWRDYEIDYDEDDAYEHWREDMHQR